MELNKIYNEDCLVGMKRIPDKSIDLVLTDPPYGIGIDGRIGGGVLAKKSDFIKKGWDDKHPTKRHFDEIFRVSKNQIIFGANHFISVMPYNSSSWIVWDKLNGENDFADCELAWTSFKKAVRKFEYRWQGMLQGDMKNKETKIHPTQKPLPLFEWIINNYSEEGQTILDPFSGSGTTAVACHRLKRKFICFEKDGGYFRDSIKRLETEMKQTSIFDFI